LPQSVKIAERTTRGRFNFVRRGNVLGHGKSPFGYKLVQNDGERVLAIHEPEAGTVRLIFDLYVNQGCSIRAVAQKLTQLGLPTANDIRGGPKSSGYGVWNPSSIGHILSNETYAGVWHYGKSKSVHGRFSKNGRDHWVAVDVPPIIERSLWDAAQERRDVNKRFPVNKKKYDYLLSGRLVCGSCGLAMSGRTTKNGDRLYQYYFCPVKMNHSPRTCDLPYFPSIQVDGAVWDWLKNWLCDPDRLAAGLEAYRSTQTRANSPILDRLETVENLLAENREQVERLLDLFLAGDFPREMLGERKSRLETTITALEEEKKSLQESLNAGELTETQTQNIIEFSKQVQMGMEKADQSFATQRQIVELLDVSVTLAVEDGERVVYLSCRLGQDVLPLMSKSS